MNKNLVIDTYAIVGTLYTVFNYELLLRSLTNKKVYRYNFSE